MWGSVTAGQHDTTGVMHERLGGRRAQQLRLLFPDSGGGKVKKGEQSPYMKPDELASRWCCARSSVDRIARRAGLTRVCLGEGKNGMVRYLREEVVAYEASRRIVMQ